MHKLMLVVRLLGPNNSWTPQMSSLPSHRRARMPQRMQGRWSGDPSVLNGLLHRSLYHRLAKMPPSSHLRLSIKDARTRAHSATHRSSEMRAGSARAFSLECPLPAH
jgi:hypothetical protein